MSHHTSHTAHAIHHAHNAEKMMEKAQHESGLTGASYGAVGSLGYAVAATMAFSLPVSWPFLAGAAVVGALFGAKKPRR